MISKCLLRNFKTYEILISTHVLIWSILDKKISKNVLKILHDLNNQFLVSTITLWEISLKYSLGKLVLDGIKPEMLLNLIEEMGYKILDLGAMEASNYHQLRGNWHNEPFDRMIIMQCLKNNLVLITKDENIKKYKIEGLTTLW